MKALLILVFLVLAACQSQRPLTHTSSTLFSTKSKLAWASDLVEKANCVFEQEELYANVKAIPSFKWTEDSGVEVASKLGSISSEIVTYKSNLFASWFRRAMPGMGMVNAYTVPSSTKIWMNTRTNPRDMRSMVMTVCHEHGHVIGYGHGSNGTHTEGVPRELEKACESVIDRCL